MNILKNYRLELLALASVCPFLAVMAIWKFTNLLTGPLGAVLIAAGVAIMIVAFTMIWKTAHKHLEEEHEALPTSQRLAWDFHEEI